jgi:UDP-glucose 4-epimerase
MKLYLVTGGAGFIGSHIAEALVDRGDRVRVLDNFDGGCESNIAHISENLEVIRGDVTDPHLVLDAMQGVDCVFHHAALASVPLSVERPLDSNHACVTGTVNALDCARRAGVRRVIYAASSAAYGESSYAMKRESDLPEPLSPYAAAKLAGEYYCQAFTHTYGLETVCLRYFNVFGPRQDPDSPYSAVIPIFITRILNGQPPIVYGDGEQTRDFTYVKNVVHGNLLAAESRAAVGRVWNIADGRQTSLLQLIAALGKALGCPVEPRFEPPRPGDVRDSLADISPAREILGYEPSIPFEKGLEMSIDYYKTLLRV